MIPKHIHQVWVGGPLPAEFEHYALGWQEMHPEWGYTLWNGPGDLAVPLVYHRAEEIVPRDVLRFRADVLRLVILWELGGVYVDTDVLPLKPLDNLVQKPGCFVSWSPNRGPRGKRLLTNAVIGARPGHPFVARCIEGLEEAVLKYGHLPLAKMIGPWHLSRVYEQYPAEVVVYPEHYFSPQSNHDRDRNLAPDLSESYAWHKWATSRDRRG